MSLDVQDIVEVQTGIQNFFACVHLRHYIRLYLFARKCTDKEIFPSLSTKTVEPKTILIATEVGQTHGQDIILKH